MPSTPPRRPNDTDGGFGATSGSSFEPTTPDVRYRWHQTPTSSPLRPGEVSPSSSATISSGANIFEPSLHSVLRSRPSVNPIPATAPIRQIFIRADPSLVTCFDPADKELYDLWAPKH